MERKPFGFPKPNFLKKKSSPETNVETPASLITSDTANPLPWKTSQHLNTFSNTSRSSETCELALDESQIGTHLTGFSNRTLSSSTECLSRFFSPATKAAAKYPFTPSRKSINSPVDDESKSPVTFAASPSPLVLSQSISSEKYPFTPSRKSINSPADEATKSPMTPAASPSPRVLSYPVSYESSEVEEFVIHRPHSSAGLPNFFQRPFNTLASEFSFTPRRKQVVPEIKSEIPSFYSSPIGFTDSNVKPFRSTPSRFRANHFLQIKQRTEQLPAVTQDQQFEYESEVKEGANELEHFYQSQLNETVDNETHLDQGEGKIDENWTNWSSSQSEGKFSFEMQVQSITEQLLVAANTQTNVKTENTSLKRALNSSQNQISNLEAQFDDLTKKQSEAIQKVRELSCENEVLCSHLTNLKEQVSSLEEQLEQNKGQCKEVNSQLEDKEQQLKAAIQNISTLEELLGSSDERLCAQQTQLQLVLTESKDADEKVKALTEQVGCQQENQYALELTMSNAENNFHSALSDYRIQQEKLEKELVNYQNTESSLKNAYTDLEAVKEELRSCNNAMMKVQTDSKAIAKEKLELDEHFTRLNEKHAICEQSLGNALENVSSLESTRNTLQAEIQQLKHQLETFSMELSATGENESRFREKNEVLLSQLDSLRKKCNDSEEKYLLSSTKMKQELHCEREEHTATKMSAEKVLSDTKNALEFQVNQLQENLILFERQTESVKQELEGEQMVHSETKSQLKVCQNQLDEDRNQHSYELAMVKDTVHILMDEKDALKFETKKFQENLIAAIKEKKLIQEELVNEKTVHSETKSFLKNCKDELENDKHGHSIELIKIKKKLQILNDKNKSLEVQVSELKENLDGANRLNESTMKELCCETTAHRETKSNWNLCKNQFENNQNDQSLEISKVSVDLQSAVQIMNEQKTFVEAVVNDLQCKLVANGRNHDATREKHLSLEHQLEFSEIEISTLRAEAHEQFNRNKELQALLDDIQMKFALSEDNMKAALCKSRKKFDSQQETHQETIRNLREVRLQLHSSERTYSETLLNQTKLQSDITNLLNEKLKIEEIVERLQKTISVQEHDIDAVIEGNLKLKKDKIELEETVKQLEIKFSFQEPNIAALIEDNASLNQTLSAYEEFLKSTHQKFKLLFTDDSEALMDATNLTTEIKTLNDKFEMIRQNSEIVDEELKDLNVSFDKLIQDNTASFMEIRERLEKTQTCLASSNEALQKATNEKSSLGNEIFGLRAELTELKKKIKTFSDNSTASEFNQEKLQSRNRALETLKSSANQQILDLQKRLHSADVGLKSSNEKAEKLTQDNENLENQLGLLRRQLQTSLEKNENAMRMHITEKEKLEKRIEGFLEAETHWESIQTRCSALNTSLALTTKNISDLHQRVQTLEKERDLLKEKVSDLIVDKTNLQSQIGSLRHQLQACHDKSNRDLEKLRNQLDTEKASHEDYKSRLTIARTNSYESKELTNDMDTKGRSNVVSKSMRFVNDNKNVDTTITTQPPSPVLSTKEQRRGLAIRRDCPQQLVMGKKPQKNQYSSENPLNELDLVNRHKNVSNKAKEGDKPVGKKLSKKEGSKPVEIIEGLPPLPTRKLSLTPSAPPRRASAAANQTLSVLIKCENSPSISTSSTEQQDVEISDEASTGRERKMLDVVPSPPFLFPMPSPVGLSVDHKRVKKIATSPKASTFPVCEPSPQLNDSFVQVTFPPAKKTYGRKRLSMTALLNETKPSPLSTLQVKKSRKTK